MPRTSPSACRCSTTCGNIEPLSLMPEMARIATEMVHDVLTAFVERDAEAALRVIERDRAVDDFYNSHLPHPADLHDGKSAQHQPVDAPAVRRQECRAGRRPCHQHRRDGLLCRDRAAPRPTGHTARTRSRTEAMMSRQAPASWSRTTARSPNLIGFHFERAGYDRDAHRRRRGSADPGRGDEARPGPARLDDRGDQRDRGLPPPAPPPGHRQRCRSSC